MKSATASILTSILLAGVSPTWAAPTPAQRCEADVELASAKFAQCRLTAEARDSKSPDAARRAAALARCSEKLQRSFSAATIRYGLNCTAEATAAFDAYITQCSDDVAAASALGGSLPDYSGELASCNANLNACTADLGTAQGDLTTCESDLAVCQATTCDNCGNAAIDGDEQCDGTDLGGATCASLGYTNGGTLACTVGCGYDTSMCASQAFPATGQFVFPPYAVDKNDGIPFPVSVAADGSVRAGSPQAYVSNGDGTITDLNTGLMWEIKSNDGGLHDKDNLYRWSGDGTQETIWDWLDELNAEGGTGFAGHQDWRVPNLNELESIRNLQNFNPAAPPEFGGNCPAECTVLNCSCTSSSYWSSSPVVVLPDKAYHYRLRLEPYSSRTRPIFSTSVRYAAAPFIQ